MDALVSFFQNVTDAQAQLVSSALSMISVLLAAVLAPLVFHFVTKKGVADFKSAIEKVTKSAEDVRAETDKMGISVEDLRTKVTEINSLLSAVQMNMAIAQSQSDEDERELEARLAQPNARQPDQDPERRNQLKAAWTIIRDRLENIASDELIDGRTRARYARIDRRDYTALVNVLGREGRLGAEANRWQRAVEIWYQYRPNNQIIPEQDLHELQDLADALRAARYEQPETQNSGLADRIQRDACAGRLPVPLTIAVVREHYPSFADGTLQTVLANYCEGGIWHSRGQPARFRRLATGQYEAICFQNTDQAADMASPN